MKFDKEAGSFYFLEEDDVIFINKREMDKDNLPFQLNEPGELSIILESPYLISFGTEMYPGIAEKAACYLYKLTKGHVFGNANKRTAYIAASIFLHVNGYKLVAETDEAFEFMLKLADNHSGLEYGDAVQFIENHMVKEQ